MSKSDVSAVSLAIVVLLAIVAVVMVGKCQVKTPSVSDGTEVEKTELSTEVTTETGSEQATQVTDVSGV
jgi:hypothetical protein